MNHEYAVKEPLRSAIDEHAGPMLLEFGSLSCGHCRAAQPLLAASLADHPKLRHVKIEDGHGRPLGRAFGVKLWPTLLFLRDGHEVARLVRPLDGSQISLALLLIDRP